MSELEALAKQLYDVGSAGCSLSWEQLGDVTRSVWLERAQAELYGDLA